MAKIDNVLKAFLGDTAISQPQKKGWKINVTVTWGINDAADGSWGRWRTNQTFDIIVNPDGTATSTAKTPSATGMCGRESSVWYFGVLDSFVINSVTEL